jgi:hypothetical protein
VLQALSNPAQYQAMRPWHIGCKNVFLRLFKNLITFIKLS